MRVQAAGSAVWILPVEESVLSGTSPAVMLSPNARNLVAFRLGPTTVTANVQLAVRCWASVAVQVTLVEPTGNDDPLDGLQPTMTGVVPPV